MTDLETAADYLQTVWDIVILGAGPSGVAAALYAQQQGARVLVIHKPDYRKPHELLNPLGLALLQNWGLTQHAAFNTHLEINQFISYWGNNQPNTQHSLFNPHGAAQLIDRQLFNQALLSHLHLANIPILADTALAVDAYKNRWQVRLHQHGTLCCQRLLLALGRVGAKRIFAETLRRADQLLALAWQWPSLTTAPTPSQFELHASANGWWYRLPAHQQRNQLVYLTDVNTLREQSGDKAAWLRRQFPASLTQTLSSAEITQIHYHPAHSHYSVYPTGPGWVQAGDNRLSRDPLSGLGLYHALSDGQRCCQFLLNDPDAPARKQFRHQHAEETWQYLQQRQAYYRVEQRFHTRFWQQRQHLTLSA